MVGASGELTPDIHPSRKKDIPDRFEVRLNEAQELEVLVSKQGRVKGGTSGSG